MSSFGENVLGQIQGLLNTLLNAPFALSSKLFS